MAKKMLKAKGETKMMLNKFIKSEYWFNFEEITYLEAYETDDETNIKATITNYAPSYCISIWYPTGVVDTSIQTALFQMIVRRYGLHYVLPCYSQDRASTEFEDLQLRVFTKLTNIYVETKDRYTTLLKLYKAEENNLMNGIKTESTGIGRFNDTPQNVMSGEDEFIDNTHVSNISKQTGETITDADTKIARLDEIRRKYADLMKEWTDEFEDMFIESENIL